MSSLRQRPVLLVGSIPLADAEEVFRTASSILGDRVRRLPDGETGVRTNWIGWQAAVFEQNPALERATENDKEYGIQLRYRLRPGKSADDIDFETSATPMPRSDRTRPSSDSRMRVPFPTAHASRSACRPRLLPLPGLSIRQTVRRSNPPTSVACLPSSSRSAPRFRTISWPYSGIRRSSSGFSRGSCRATYRIRRRRSSTGSSTLEREFRQMSSLAITCAMGTPGTSILSNPKTLPSW